MNNTDCKHACKAAIAVEKYNVFLLVVSKWKTNQKG